MSRKDTLWARSSTRLTGLVQQHEEALLEDWLARQKAAATRRVDLISDSDLRAQSMDFLRQLTLALQGGHGSVGDSPSWEDVRDGVAEVSRTRAQLGFSPGETATFVYSLKEPIFSLLRREIDDPAVLLEELWSATTLLDSLGLLTIESYQKGREEVIMRQQQELMELSTPVVTLWEGVLALPLIGTLDSARTQVVMESLLERIATSGSSIAIIDITGVPTVDTIVAQHLMKTVAAARLMGAECIISGIRPQIAQTIVHLGVELGTVITKATLADAFGIALARTGRRVVSIGATATEKPSRNGSV